MYLVCDVITNNSFSVCLSKKKKKKEEDISPLQEPLSRLGIYNNIKNDFLLDSLILYIDMGTIPK